MSRFALASLAVALAWIVPRQALCAPHTVLHSFSASYMSGRSPQGRLVLADDGNLYGCTISDAQQGAGTIFHLSPSGAFSTRFVFPFDTGTGTYPFGRSPVGSLVRGGPGDPDLYGVTALGGPLGDYGVAFRYDYTAGTVTVLHAFGGYNPGNPVASDGEGPRGGLIRGSDGAFYGVTLSGGVHNGGTVYRVTAGGGYTLLHPINHATEGYYPESRLIEGADGSLYGTTALNGLGYGVLFRISKDGSGYAVVHQFTGSGVGSTGDSPTGDLARDSSGNLYGACYRGGAGNVGTLYRYSPGTGEVTVLHHFNGLSGGYPLGGLARGADGRLYGTSQSGGIYGFGTAYRITTGGAMAVVRSFAATDVYGAIGLMETSAGTWYGLCWYAGVTDPIPGYGGHGRLYRLKVTSASTTYAPLHDFFVQNAHYPYSGLVLSPNDGRYYGTTQSGGAFGNGTVYRIDPAGKLTILVHLLANTTGGMPSAGLTLGSDGSFYGVTGLGGLHGRGTLFRMTPSGSVTVLHHFHFAEGSGVEARLTQGKDGAFYGVALAGGAANQGTVFRCTNAGSLTVLHHFVGPDGAKPLGALWQDAAGILYGTTELGGDFDQGTVYKLSATGAGFTTLHHFGLDGSRPTAGVVPGPGGLLYGTTFFGGLVNYGIVYRISPAGAFGVVHQFAAGESANPYAPVTVGADGMLYGVTTSHGTFAAGAVYRIDPSTGAYAPLHDFEGMGAGTTGGDALGELVIAPDGALVGTTYFGGDADGGTVFRVDAGIPTARDVTGDVTLSRTVTNLGGGSYRWVVTVTPKTGKAILLPISLPVIGLAPTGAVVANKTGDVPGGYGGSAGAPYVASFAGPSGPWVLRSTGRKITVEISGASDAPTASLRVWQGRF